MKSNKDTLTRNNIFILPLHKDPHPADIGHWEGVHGVGTEKSNYKCHTWAPDQRQAQEELGIRD